LQEGIEESMNDVQQKANAYIERNTNREESIYLPIIGKYVLYVSILITDRRYWKSQLRSFGTNLTNVLPKILKMWGLEVND
jgi:hypothetical protein